MGALSISYTEMASKPPQISPVVIEAQGESHRLDSGESLRVSEQKHCTVDGRRETEQAEEDQKDDVEYIAERRRWDTREREEASAVRADLESGTTNDFMRR